MPRVQPPMPPSESEAQRAQQAFAHIPNVPVPVQPGRTPSQIAAPAVRAQPTPQPERPQDGGSIPDSPTLTSYQAPAAFAFVQPRPSALPNANPEWIEKTQKKIGSGENPAAPAAFGSNPGTPSGAQPFASPGPLPQAPASAPAPMSPRPSGPSYPGQAAQPSNPSIPGPVPSARPTRKAKKSHATTIAIVVAIILVLGAAAFVLFKAFGS